MLSCCKVTSEKKIHNVYSSKLSDIYYKIHLITDVVDPQTTETIAPSPNLFRSDSSPLQVVLEIWSDFPK